MYCWVCTSKTKKGGVRYWRGLCAQCNSDIADRYNPGAPLPHEGTLLYWMYDGAVAREQSFYARSIHVGKSLGGEVVLKGRTAPSAKEAHAMWIVSYVCDQMGWERPVTTHTCSPIHLEVLRGRDTGYKLSERLTGDEDMGEDLPMLPE